MSDSRLTDFSPSDVRRRWIRLRRTLGLEMEPFKFFSELLTMKNKILILSLALLSASCFSNPPVTGGIVKTTDGGADWQFSNTIQGSTTVSLGAFEVSSMAIDPQNRQNVFAGGYSGGLYKSTNAGGSWANILSKIYVYDFGISPLDSKTMYAAGSFAGNGEVVKTTDGGATWQEVYNEASSDSVVRNIALNPAGPSQMVIGTQSGNIIKSIDSGKDWQLLKNFQDQVNALLWKNNAIYVLLKTKGLYISTDGGLTFTEITKGISKQSIDDIFPSSTAVSSFSHVAVSASNPSIIYITTDQGLYRTLDAGQTWTHLQLPVKSDASLTKAVTIAPESDSIVFTCVGATIYKTLDSGQTWQTQKVATNGFINYILVDPTLPQIAYAGIYVSQ